MKVLSATRVNRNGSGARIQLPEEALLTIGVSHGDLVQLIEFQGRVFIQKVAPPAES